MVIRGCQEGKMTPKLMEVRCPKCGEDVEVFVRMNGRPGQTGTLYEEAVCDECGHVLEEGTPIDQLL